MAGKSPYSDELKASWVTRAQAGVSAFAIGQTDGIHHTTVSHHLKKMGVFRRNYDKNSKLSPEDKKAICNRYAAGESPTVLASEYKVDRAAIAYTLNRAGVGTRPAYKKEGPLTVKRTHRKGGTWGKKKSNIKHDALNVLTNEALYWIGFIAADGCVGVTEMIAGKSPRVLINLSAVDIGHLNSLLRFFGSDRKARYQEHKGGFAEKVGSASTDISSLTVVNRLIELGVMPQKGKDQDTLFSDELVRSADFWRGMFDGDGSFSSYVPYLSGSKAHLQQWKLFCLANGIETSDPVFRKTTYRSEFSPSSIASVARVLQYEKESAPALLRKRVSAFYHLGIRREPRENRRQEPEVDINGEELLIDIGDVRVSCGLVAPGYAMALAKNYVDSSDSHRTFWVRVQEKLKERGLRLLLVLPGDSSFGWKNRVQSLRKTANRKKGARAFNAIRLGGPEAREFYERVHVQGASSASRHYGLVDNTTIVAAMSFAVPSISRAVGADQILTRFAVDGHVPGAASRLLALAQLDRPGQSIITFSDNRYSTGAIYSLLGFDKIGVVPPSYLYVKGDAAIRKERMQRKHLLLELGADPDQTYDLSERALARKAGYQRIYDVGKVKWLLTPS